MSIPNRPRSAVDHHGFALIELMIAMTVALLSSILIFQTVIGADTTRRNLIGSNDSLRSGSLAMDQLGWMVRSAGAGIAQVPGAFGCKLSAWVDGARRLPRHIGVDAPFDLLPTDLRLAPVLAIDGGEEPDVLFVAIGSSPLSNLPIPGASVADDGATVQVPNTYGLLNGDTLLLTRLKQSAGHVTAADCVLTQVPDTASTDPNGYLQSNPFSIQNAPMSAPAYAVLAGPFTLSTLGRSPKLLAVGVRKSGGRRDLVMMDMLSSDWPKVRVLAENVVDFQVLYGVDNTVNAAANVSADPDYFGDGTVDQWVAPVEDWSVTAMGATAPVGAVPLTGAERLRRVKSLKLALITADAVVEKNDVARASADLTMFSSAGPSLTLTRTIGTTPFLDAKQRYRVFETTVPVRNLTAPLSPVDPGLFLIY